MFRILHNFKRICTLQTSENIISLIKQSYTQQAEILWRSKRWESNALSASLQTVDNFNEARPSSTQLDTEDYIVPYQGEDEKGFKRNVLVALDTHFRLTRAETKLILRDESINRLKRGSQIVVRTLDMLLFEGVRKQSFLDYPWILTFDPERLQLKIIYLRKLPLRDFNHFVPFLRLTVPTLRKIVNLMNAEASIVPAGNRVYYISQKLSVDPFVVTKYLHKRLFVLQMPFEMLQETLHHMIQFKITPISILKDLWAFRYAPKSVQLRLQRAKNAKKEKIMPWMVRCSEPILQRSFQITMDEAKVLGDTTSTVEYFAKRLNMDLNTAKGILSKHPQTLTVRGAKMKEVLDYLLDEAGYGPLDIAQVPRILCHSLRTTKQRLEELKKVGCRPFSLVIVCRSKREYEKFLTAWLHSNPKYRNYGNSIENESMPETLRTVVPTESKTNEIPNTEQMIKS